MTIIEGINAALATVQDPELHHALPELGMVESVTESGGVVDLVQTTGSVFAPSLATPYALSSRHGATFVNGAYGGTILTADTTPTSLPNLSAANCQLGNIFMGTIAVFRQWDEDIGDAGITAASQPLGA